MISNECNGCEYKCSLSHIDICTLGSPCPHQRSTPMTEQEWLQTCNTEQLAEFLIVSIKKCKSCASGIGSDEVQHCPFGECGCHFKGEVIEWLKKPHSEVGK